MYCLGGPENKALKAEGFPAGKPPSLLCGVKGEEAATHGTLAATPKPLPHPETGLLLRSAQRRQGLVFLKTGRKTRTQKNVSSKKQVKIIITFPGREPGAAGLKQRQHEAVEEVRAPAAPVARALHSSQIR